ncbi:MAG: polysaccharide deacetylase family protein [Gammaproteobacteria bacterium]|nr:polysaccharide deacetylase family protein [Gammaproteobacteria bacterium]
MQNTISILMYHQVGDFPPMPAHRSTYCHYRRFQAQMAYLKRLRYRVLSLDHALACLNGAQPIPPRAVVLTFDDGYENFYEFAWPVLKRYGFPCIVYLLSGLLGQASSWFATDGRQTPPLMDRERILQLRDAGVDFGSHGVSHVKLAEVDAGTVRREVTDSKQTLEALLDHQVRHFCYPYGSHDLTAVEAVEAAGYVSAVTCQRAAATPAFDPFLLPRKAISYGDNLAGYFWKLAMKDKPKGEPLRWRT